MSFDSNKTALVQEHFTVVELDLPVFSSGQTCSLAGGTGYYTPLTCEEAWDEVTFKTYYFGTKNVPDTFGRPPSSAGMPGDIIDLGREPVRRVLSGVSEQVTRLQPGEGLAIQGTASISMIDTEGDPGPVTTTEAGTFFGKLHARNILTNKEIRIKHYHVTQDGVYAESDALTRSYLVDGFENKGNGRWSLLAKDELSKLDPDKTQFPVPTGGTLRTDINASVTSIPVDSATDWEQEPRPYVIKSGDELMKVTAVTNNLTASASLTVDTRGNNIVFTNLLSTTTAEEHSAGDDVQICYTSDNQDIDEFLEEVLVAAGVPASNIPSADWAAEITQWHPSDKINTIWHEPNSSNSVVSLICTGFLLDIWFDNEDREVKLSAISVWEESGPTVVEGQGIDYKSMQVVPKDRMRFTRAFVYYDKPNKVANDDIENYRAVSVNTNPAPEAAGLYDESKTKEFPNSPVLGQNAADLLVQRTTARFGFTPDEYLFTTQEKFLNYKTGNVIDLLTKEKQGFDGEPQPIRAQVLSVQPVMGPEGRFYRTSALTFEPAFADGAEFLINSNSNNINIHTFVGAPSTAVNVTIVIDGVTISSLDADTPALVAGGFAGGSVITLLLINDAVLQAGGGNGGGGGSSFGIDPGDFPPFTFNNPGVDGGDGGTVYDAQGVDTDIYLGGTVGSETALGVLRAPGGGGGGTQGTGVNGNAVGGQGGGGGAGSNPGAGGAGGVAQGTGSTTETPGVGGTDGTSAGAGGTGGVGSPDTAGSGGAWGVAGTDGGGSNNGTGGDAGKGIVKMGGVVNILTDGNTGRFTNGAGDTPDSLT